MRKNSGAKCPCCGESEVVVETTTGQILDKNRKRVKINDFDAEIDECLFCNTYLDVIDINANGFSKEAKPEYLLSVCKDNIINSLKYQGKEVSSLDESFINELFKHSPSLKQFKDETFTPFIKNKFEELKNFLESNKFQHEAGLVKYLWGNDKKSKKEMQEFIFNCGDNEIKGMVPNSTIKGIRLGLDYEAGDKKGDIYLDSITNTYKVLTLNDNTYNCKNAKLGEILNQFIYSESLLLAVKEGKTKDEILNEFQDFSQFHNMISKCHEFGEILSGQYNNYINKLKEEYKTTQDAIKNGGYEMTLKYYTPKNQNTDNTPTPTNNTYNEGK